MSEKYFSGSIRIIEGSTGIVFQNAGSDLFAEKPVAEPLKVIAGKKEAKKKVIPWGDSNAMPNEIIDKIDKSGVVSTNISFKRDIIVGSGRVEPVKITYNNGHRVIEPYENEEVRAFFENNDTLAYLMGAASDLVTFNWPVPELVFNADVQGKRKVVQVQALQATFSRLEEMDIKTGMIEGLYYSAQWNEKPIPDPDKVKRVRLLPTFNTVNYALGITGKAPNPISLETKDEMDQSLALLMRTPSPGKIYYPKPFWWAVFQSGWYDYTQSLLDYKKALVNKQLSIKYHIEFSDKYFPRIFDVEKVAQKDQQARVDEEYTNIAKTLQGKDNAGGTFYSYFEHHPSSGNMLSMVKINVLSNPNKDGEYIEEIENSINLINYFMRVHGSLISSLGGNKTINGTEARELFNMAQALAEPERNLLLRPYYVTKALNNWPKDMHFIIPNMELTRLDENTGATKSTSAAPLG